MSKLEAPFVVFVSVAILALTFVVICQGVKIYRLERRVDEQSHSFSTFMDWQFGVNNELYNRTAPTKEKEVR